MLETFLSGKRVIDVSIGLQEGLPTWPGDPKPRIEKFLSLDKGDCANATQINCSVHIGTHLDAPSHFLRHDRTADRLEWTKLLGRCYVVEVASSTREISSQVLKTLEIPKEAKKLLFKTSNSKLWENPKHEFFADFTALTPDGAEWIASRECDLVGIDYLSIQRFSDPTPKTHHLLLEKEIILLEGLDLRQAKRGWYDLMCLPLKIVGCDGAPARVLLIEDQK